MRHRHVHAGGAGQPPDDRLAIGGHRAHAHPVAGDLGLVQSADDPAGAPQQLVRPAPQLRVGRMQVDGRVGGFQMDRAVPIGPQVHVGCVHHPGQAGHRRGADDEPRRFGPGRLPRHERHRAGRTRQPGQLRNLAPGTAHDHLRRDQRACRRVHVACRARRPARPAGGPHRSPVPPRPPSGRPRRRRRPRSGSRPRARSAGSSPRETRRPPPSAPTAAAPVPARPPRRHRESQPGIPTRSGGVPAPRAPHARGRPAPTRGSRTPGTRPPGRLPPRGRPRPACPHG